MLMVPCEGCEIWALGREGRSSGGSHGPGGNLSPPPASAGASSWLPGGGAPLGPLLGSGCAGGGEFSLGVGRLGASSRG